MQTVCNTDQITDRTDDIRIRNTTTWATITPSLRWQGKLNFSETVDDINTDSDARFAVRRGGFGFAFCLLKNSHLNILGRVNLTYELPPLSQSTAQNIAVDERSLVASVEMAYPVSRLWEAGSGKLAFKEAQIRNARDAGV